MASSGYGRFYALLSKHPHLDKNEIVSQFTDGRTTHLTQMSRKEYDEMCDYLAYGNESERAAEEKELRRARSSVLLRIGRLGISTVDNWEGIDAFCMSPKIAGKRFCKLTSLELRGLVPKLESILRRGGLKSLDEEKQSPAVDEKLIMQLATYNNQNKKKS